MLEDASYLQVYGAKMKTVLINPNCSTAKGINKATIEPPLGIGYLATYLKREGFESEIIDANILQLSEDEIYQRIDGGVKIVGISFNVISAIAAFKLVKYLKPKFPGVIFIAGGPYPSSMPESCLNSYGFDAVCIGEGEEVLLKIARHISNDKMNPFEDVNGVYYRYQDNIIKNPPQKLIGDLDALPFVDLGLFPNLLLYKSRARAKPVGVILTSRGCPYQCIYCNKNIFFATYRLRSVNNVITEIEQQINRFGIKQIDFLDDNLTLNVSYANNLFDEIIAKKFNLYINLQNGVRADLLNENLIRKMKKAGVFKVSIGVETGDSSMQKRIKKYLDLDKVIETTKLFKKYGIRVYGNFMFGLPYDTRESMQKTLDFAIKMNPDIANFMITIPLPGTELYELVKSKGSFFEDPGKGVARGFYGGKVYYTLNGMDSSLIAESYKKSYKKFYYNPRKIFEIVKSANSVYELKWIYDAAIEVFKSIL